MRVPKHVTALAMSAVALIGLGVTVMDPPAGAANSAQLKAKALSLSDMPTGWSVDNGSSSGGVSHAGGCLKVLTSFKKPPKGIAHANVRYEDGGVRAVSESIGEGKAAAADYAKYLKVMNGCTTLSFTTDGAMSLSTVGDASAAYAFAFTAKGVKLGLDLVLFKAGSVIGDLAYEDIGTPDAGTFQAFATDAVNRIEGKPTTTPTGSA